MFNSRNIKAFDDFKSGLKFIGHFWDWVQLHRNLLANLLLLTDEVLTANTVQDLLEYEFSEPGTNRFTLEQETAFSLTMFLSNLKSNHDTNSHYA